MLLASRVDWGSVPDWIAGIGSVLAFAAFTVAFMWEVRKRRQGDEQDAKIAVRRLSGTLAWSLSRTAPHRRRRSGW
jgi:hypothetical protein